jgi:hypothetical protein
LHGWLAPGGHAAPPVLEADDEAPRHLVPALCTGGPLPCCPRCACPCYVGKEGWADRYRRVS